MIKTVLQSRRTLFFINFKEFLCLAFAFVRCILSSIVATRLYLAKRIHDHTTIVCYILTPRQTFLVSVYLLGCVSLFCIRMLHVFHWWSQWFLPFYNFTNRFFTKMTSHSVLHPLSYKLRNLTNIYFQHTLISFH